MATTTPLAAPPPPWDGLLTADPFSDGYRRLVQSSRAAPAIAHALPFPTTSGDEAPPLLSFAAHASFLAALALQGPQAVLLIGGDGELAFTLARMGARVTRAGLPGRPAPWIDPKSHRASIRQAPLADVLDAAAEGSAFDRVVFAAALERVPDHAALLRRLKPVLNPGGRIVFVAEPIFAVHDPRHAALPYAWGPLGDGVRLGFRREYFVQLLAGLGYAVMAPGDEHDSSGSVLAATPSGSDVDLGAPLLLETLACPGSWHAGEGAHRWSRTTAAEIPLDGSAGWTRGRLALCNLLNLSRRVVFAAGEARTTIDLAPSEGCAVTFAMPPGERPVLRIESAVTVMREYAPESEDPRTLGIAVRWLEYDRDAAVAPLRVERTGNLERRARPPAAGTRLRVEFGGEPLAIESAGQQAYADQLAHWPAANRAFLEALGRVPEDAVCLDVGAHIGVTACLLGRRARRGRVFAFEAAPEAAAILRRNLAANGIGHAQVVEAALSDRSGTLRFHEAANAAGAHAVTPSFPGEAPPTVSLPALTLDEWAESQPGLAPVRFIKIDVEGFEPNVLAGAARLIARDRPVILMEFNAWCLNAFHGYSPSALVTSLLRCFEIEIMGASGRFEPSDDPLRILHHNLVENDCVSDLLLRPLPGTVVPPLRELVG